MGSFLNSLCRIVTSTTLIMTFWNQLNIYNPNKSPILYFMFFIAASVAANWICNKINQRN